MRTLMCLCIVAVLSGCSHLHVTNKTVDGTEFTAVAWSFCWDRNLGNLQFDYQKGTLGVSEYTSTPDKETLGKGLDMIKSGLELVKKVAP
jgi:hypothetical protein